MVYGTWQQQREGRSSSVRFLPAGDRAVFVQFGEEISPAVHLEVMRFYRYMAAHPIAGVEETVVTYRSAMVVYDAMAVPFPSLLERLREHVDGARQVELPNPQVVELPACYEGDLAPDLEEVAGRIGLSPDELIRMHAADAYPVYCLGFTPGFAFLGGLAPRLHLPRKSEPRVRVPAGSVGIGGQQTGVYSVASPGGWHLIGRTPVPLYLPDQQPPTLLHPGNLVRFQPLSRSEFDDLAAQIAAGEYEVARRPAEPDELAAERPETSTGEDGGP